MTKTAQILMEEFNLTAAEAVKEDKLREEFIRSGAFDESFERHMYADNRGEKIEADFQSWKKALQKKS